MELTDETKQVYIETATALKGSERRLFRARVVKSLGSVHGSYTLRHAVEGDVFLCGFSAENAPLPEGHALLFPFGWLRLDTSSTAAANSCGAS